MRAFLHATATLIGMIVGVGLFAVPYVSAQAGLAVGAFWIVLLGLLSLLVHSFFGEVVAGTTGKHRLAGYAQRYLGRGAKKIVTISQTLAFWGAQVAYLLVGGVFLRVLINGYGEGSTLFYTLAIFLFVAFITFLGLRIFDRVEFWMTWVLLVIIVVILGLGAPHVEAQQLLGVDRGALFFPYGVVLFALGGAAAVPEMWEIVRRRTRPFYGGIVAGTLISVAITLLFAIIVVGITGAATTPEAFEGLEGVLGSGVVRLGALFGFFAVVTSYLVIALYLTDLFAYDFRVKRVPAWFFAVCIPLLFVLAGAKDFVGVLDLVGSVFGGFDGIMILVVSLAFFKRRHVARRKLKTALGIVGIALLAVGLIQKLVQLL